MQTSNQRDGLIPITLLTGFLGSGKTTLLNHLLQAPEMSDTLVIVNEFGEIGLDHLLMTHSAEDVIVEMNSGCLCCTIRGDLVATLRDITWRFSRGGKRQFKRVYIETTGLADPAPIVHTLVMDDFIASKYRLDAIVTTIDVFNAMNTLNAHPEAVKQAAIADCILLTKSDMVSVSQSSNVVERLQTINPAAQMIPVQQGKIDIAQLVNIPKFDIHHKTTDVAKWLNDEAYSVTKAPAGDKDHDHSHAHHSHETHAHPDNHHAHEDAHHHDVNRHDDHIHAFCFTVDKPIHPAAFEAWIATLTTLMGEKMLRIKGILNLEGEKRPVVIHGVQHIFHPTFFLNTWPTENRQSKIVFITKDLERGLIARSFDKFISSVELEKSAW